MAGEFRPGVLPRRPLLQDSVAVHRVQAQLHQGFARPGIVLVAFDQAVAQAEMADAFHHHPAAPVEIRLAGEAGAGISLVWIADTALDSPVSMVFGVVLVVIAVNAVNLFDGLDGLVGSVSLVSAIGLAWAGLSGYGDSALGFTLAGAVAGFLILNWKPARVFLGDSGAYLIGTVLAYGALVGGGGDAGTTLLVILAVLGVFLIDLVTTITRRALKGTPMLEGDRSHIYDRLRDRGWGFRAIALFAASSQAILVVISIGPL